jgi:exodeoxyribonuclease III
LLIVSWNIENLARALPSLPEIHHALGTPDVLCLQETRVRAIDHELIRAMTTALPGFDCHYATSNDPRNVTFRGGRMYGVTTYIRGAEPSTLPWDREGRVVVSELPDLVIVNVYAVNGTTKPYFDQDLDRFDGDRNDFKRRFNMRLMEELKRFAKPLIAIGDWNISRAKIDIHPRLRTEEPHATARKQFNEVFILTLGLVDVFRHLHPDAKKYTWFRRNARTLDAARVDYALISESLLPRVREADIREDDRFGSDHAPVILRIDR